MFKPTSRRAFVQRHFPVVELPSDKLVLNEVFAQINGERHCLWRAVDHEGELCYEETRQIRSSGVHEASVEAPREAETIVTDGLRSYPAAIRDLGNVDRPDMGRWLNNRAENSDLPFRRREYAILRFRQMKTLQNFVSVRASFVITSTPNAISSTAKLVAIANMQHSAVKRFDGRIEGSQFSQ